VVNIIERESNNYFSDESRPAEREYVIFILRKWSFAR
jgi:hypothetical protein